jgi:DNA polymerase-3 subunit gamma/tau
VVFVLATTEPQKVVATIRSRTQHFEFKLLPGDELADHLRWVIQDAGLDVDQAGIDYALRQGGGSARDTLSALDLVAAAGGVPAGSDIGLELALAIGEGDPPATVASVERAIEDGREPRVIAETTLQTLRHAFLAAMGAPLAHLDERARAQAGEIASKLGPATITRSLEMLGQALVEMRQAPDARVPLEVALLRLARRDGLDTVGLLQRIEQLERQIAELASTLPAAGSTRPSAQPAATRPTAPAGSGAPSDLRPTTTSRQSAHDTGDAPPPPPRRQAGRQVSTPPASADIDPVATPTAAPAPTPEPTADNEPAAGNESAQPLDLAELTAALDGGVLESVSQRARSRFAAAKPVAADQHRAIFSVPNAYYVPRCEEVLPEIESAFARRFGRPITISLTVDQDAVQSNPNPSNRPRSTSPAASDPEPDEDIGDISALADAGDVATTGIERLTQAFPGSQVIESFDRSPH